MRFQFLLGLSSLLMVCAACHQHQKTSHTESVVSHSAPKPKPASTHPTDVSEFASKLQLQEKDIRANKLYQFSEAWYGVPYRYGGCDRKGIDCSCFAILLYQEVYKRSLARSSQDMFKTCDQISMDEVAQGDLLFFKIGGTSISHVGVYLKGNYFIHSSTSKGVVINSLEEAYYKKYFFCAGKIKNT